MKSKKTSVEKQFLNLVTFNKLMRIDFNPIFINFLNDIECVKYGKMLITDYGFYCENAGLNHRFLTTDRNLAGKSLYIYTDLTKDNFAKSENVFFYSTFDRIDNPLYKCKRLDYIQRDINIFDKVEWNDNKKEYKVIETYTFEGDYL